MISAYEEFIFTYRKSFFLNKNDYTPLHSRVKSIKFSGKPIKFKVARAGNKVAREGYKILREGNKILREGNKRFILEKIIPILSSFAS